MLENFLLDRSTHSQTNAQSWISEQSTGQQTNSQIVQIELPKKNARTKQFLFLALSSKSNPFCLVTVYTNVLFPMCSESGLCSLFLGFLLFSSYPIRMLSHKHLSSMKCLTGKHTIQCALPKLFFTIKSNFSSEFSHFQSIFSTNLDEI